MNSRGSMELKILEEAKALVKKMAFSAASGDYLEGERVTVLVDPRLRDDDDTMDVLLTCLPSGIQTLNWTGLAVSATKERGAEEWCAVAFFDRRGQALFSSLSPARYSLGLLEHEEAVELIKRPGRMSGKTVVPALLSLLNFVCDSSLPPGMRVSSSQIFSSETAGYIRDADLSPYASSLLDTRDALKPENITAGLEHALSRAFGSIMSQRSLERKDEQLALTALVQRCVAIEDAHLRNVRAAPSDALLRTRGHSRSRGAARTLGAGADSPLVTLARSGGPRMRDSLIDFLTRKPGNEERIEMLRRIVLCE